jgi:hypothetical protein
MVFPLELPPTETVPSVSDQSNCRGALSSSALVVCTGSRQRRLPIRWIARKKHFSSDLVVAPLPISKLCPSPLRSDRQPESGGKRQCTSRRKRQHIPTPPASTGTLQTTLESLHWVLLSFVIQFHLLLQRFSGSGDSSKQPRGGAHRTILSPELAYRQGSPSSNFCVDRKQFPWTVGCRVIGFSDSTYWWFVVVISSLLRTNP